MSFLSPAAFVFAAAIPVVIVFYLLKRKRVVKLISSTLLWQKFLAETQANAPFQRLRHNWLLILQILMLLLAVFALARPFFSGESKASQLRVVILDGSASMQATDEKPSRFEKARAEALKWVDGLRDNERMMVLLAGASTEVKQSPTTDKTVLRRAIESCAPADTSTRIGEALNTAAAFTHEKRGEEEVSTGEIHLFSDGAIPNLADFANKNLPLVYHRIGQRGNNLGIATLDVRPNPDNPAQRAIFTSVVNPTAEAQQTEIELSFENNVIEVRPITVPPTNTLPLVFLADQSRDGVFTVRLTSNDDLAADNQASIVSPLPRSVNVLLVSRGNALIEKVLRACPNVKLSTASVLTDSAPGFDIVVLDDVTPTVWPQANTLAIHITSTNLFPSVSRVEGPAIVDWKSTHPLLRFVDLDPKIVQIAESLAVKTPNWGVSIADSPQTPVILAGELDHHRVVWIGFDTLQSTWPLRTSFPIFFQNAMDWLNPALANASQFTVRAGESFRFALSQPVESAQVISPDGSVNKLNVDSESREIVFGGTSKQGVYHLKAGTNEIAFCVNLMDAAESDIKPHDELPLGNSGARVIATNIKRANMELWRWIAAAGLFVLLFEWWYYHKRTA